MTRKERQEIRDYNIYDKITDEDNPYKDASKEENIEVGKRCRSIRWILLYAHARNSGMVCVYMSHCYANEMLGLDDWYDEDTTWTRACDARALHIANTYLREHGLLKKPPQPKRDLQTA